MSDIPVGRLIRTDEDGIVLQGDIKGLFCSLGKHQNSASGYVVFKENIVL